LGNKLTLLSNNHIKIAVIGNGKTGKAVVNNLPAENIHDIYTIDHPISLDNLYGANIAIVFVNHIALAEILPILLQAKIPTICATTGFDWTDVVKNDIYNSQSTWVVANNFSLSMHLIKNCIEILGNSQQLLSDINFNIHEVHHTQKLDAPSGTAISWNEWLNINDTNITYDRTDDVAGQHILTITTPNEIITLSHTALNRNLFAEGAIWAADQLISHSDLKPGIIHFSQLIEHTLTHSQTQEEYSHA
jgi:4-hydroxy-tetrahydrodipicolinate reductase